MSDELPDSSQQTLTIRAWLRKTIGQGFPIYTEIVAELADKISWEEAEEARRANRRDLRLLAAAVLCGALVQFLMYRSPKNPVNLQILLLDLYRAGSLLLPLLLVSGFRIHYAGRLLLPLAVLGSQYRHPIMSWDFNYYWFMLLPNLGLVFILGALLDFGASTVPGRKWIRLRRWTLLIPGLFFLRLWMLRSEDLGGYVPVLSILAALACCVWGWIPGERLARLGSLAKEDSETLRLMALSRWALFARGRVLAISIGIVPCILFLNSLELRGMLTPQADAVRTRKDGQERVWFWTHKGEFLTSRHLKDGSFYAFLDSDMKTKDLRQIWKADDSLRGTIHDTDNYDELLRSYAKLEDFLKSHKLTSPAQLDLLLAQSKAKGVPLELYYLARDPIRAKGPIAAVPAIFSVEDQLWVFTNRMDAFTADDIRQYLAHNGIWQWLLLGYGVMGFTFLWRRGGDSVLARWLGIWLMGVGIAGSYHYARLFLPALGFDLWHRALIHPSGNLMLSVMVLLDLVALAVFILFALFVPLAAIWCHACWPVKRQGERTRRWLPVIPLWLRIALVSLAMSGFFYALLLGLPFFWPSELGSTVAAVTAFIAVVFTAGYRLWRPKQSAVRPLDWILGLLLTGIQAVVMTAIVGGSGEVAMGFKMAGLVLGFTLLAILAFLIFRRDLFHVSAARDFSFVIVYMLFPALFAWSENQSTNYLFDLTHGFVVSERGAGILGVVLVIALLPPIHRVVEKGILRISAPRLRRVQECIGETLDRLIDEGEDPLGRIGDALQTCGVEQFAFYRRAGLDSFEVLIWKDLQAKDRVRISPPLLRFLADQRDFLDLDRVALEWRFFFVQFELHRLQGDLGGRHLLPVCLGKSLRGFLVVPGRTRREGRRRIESPLIEGLTTLGVAAAHLSPARTLVKPPGELATAEDVQEAPPESIDFLPGVV